MVGRGPRLPDCPRSSTWRLPATVLLWPPLALSQPLVGDAGTLDEIIVTARKVAEPLANVPLSVQVVPGDIVSATNLTDFYDLQYDVPGLVVTSAGTFGANLSLRGVTDQGGTSLAVAPHFNGVYLGSSALMLARLFDVHQIEVVKGPQGTLYGRNATGGSINVLTRRPEEAFSAGIESAYGSYDTVRMQGHVNIAGSTTAARVAVAASGGSGYIRNSVDSRTFGEDDFVGVRGALRYQPSDTLTLDLMAQRVEDDGATGELWSPRPDYLPDPRDIRLTTVTHADPHLATTNEFASVDLRYDFSAASLRSISGYARNETRNTDDCAGVPFLQGCVRSMQPAIHEQWSQELRLESSVGDKLDWIAGLFYFDSRASTRFFFTAPLLAPAPINDYAAVSDESAWAAFGQVSRRLGERWRISAGLRLSRESDRVADSGTGLDDNPLPVSAKTVFDNSAWRLDLQYSPSDRLLAYASVATGFKSGGITTELLPNGEFDDYEAEELTAYEAGLNWRGASRRLSLRASVFQYEFQDLQVQQVIVLANTVVSAIDNAASARIHGTDVSAVAEIGDRITVSGGAVWMPTREYVRFVAAATGDSLSGNVISRAPEWSVSLSVDLRWPIQSFGELSFRTDYNYRSRFFFTPENSLAAAQDSFGLLNMFVRLQPHKSGWYLFGSGRNLLDIDYFQQVFLQSAPGHGTTWEVGAGIRF